MVSKGFPNVTTSGRQYNFGEKPSVILYTYINLHAGTPKPQSFLSKSPGLQCSIGSERELYKYINFVLLRFRIYAFVEAAALRSILLRYARAPIATRVFFLFFVVFEMSLFPSIFLYHFRFIFVWRVRRTFFPSFRMVFFYVLPCDHGRDCFTSIYVRFQSISQSHGESTIAPTTRFPIIRTDLSRREVRASQQEADLVRKICGAHGECQMIAEVHDIRRNGGGRELCGGAGKIIVDGVFPGRPSWWYSPESR